MSAKTTLIATLPILFILTALAAAIFFLPDNLDIRNRASEPSPTLAPESFISPTQKQQPVVGCSGLYDPVCGADNLTYENECEAGLANITVAYTGECQNTNTPIQTQ